MARVYKEGQGKTARGLLVITIVLAAFAALGQLYGSLPRGPKWSLIYFTVDYRFVVLAPVFLALLYFAYWLFNRPRTADFLIDTEHELRNKVTWPSQKEEVNASIVVVVMVFVLGAFIFAFDALFGWLVSDLFFGVGS
jgi:preprotein translocase SecE subunit